MQLGGKRARTYAWHARTHRHSDGLLQNFDRGMTIEELLEDYGLAEEKVRDVLSFASRLIG
jgi:uncharacterized protein (DUF433 family)